ncbi:MAG TPA: hypothetical protein DEB39_15800 [Planctomycetaceae bacterium]|nr:hypothetical protein [Planctomycetaceae bacterium]
MSESAFHTTHWSVVLTAKGDDAKAQSALGELCETYHAPILRYIGRRLANGSPAFYGGRAAEDLTQDFLAKVLEGKMFDRVQRQGGTFRSYLLGAVRHFLAHTRERESAAKRGGGAVPSCLPDDLCGPEEVDDAEFDRDWAQTTIDRAVDALDKKHLALSVRILLPWLIREMDGETRSRLAAELGISDVAVKVALHRLRKKFGESVRKRIAETVEHPSEIDGELAYLIRALRGSGACSSAR